MICSESSDHYPAEICRVVLPENRSGSSNAGTVSSG